MKMNKTNKSEYLLDVSLVGRWEALVVGRRLPQGPLTISKPGKPNHRNSFLVYVVYFCMLGCA